jgi:hypothetical protein
MTTRDLPPGEWPRLAGTLLEHAWPDFDQQTTRIVVVEEQGAIVACAAVFQRWHLEGAWLAPQARGRISVGRALLLAVRGALAALCAREVLVMCTSAVGRHLCMRIGRATPLECDHFSVEVNHA